MANLYIYEQTTSTNDRAKSDWVKHSDIIWAYSQSAGRGQRGNRWMGGRGENITFSILLEPTFLAASDQFLISQITALSLCEAMAKFGIETRIKWTNDIYVADRKMAGILIENSIGAVNMTRSVVGIGLNINQIEFDSSLPNPTSMCVEGGRSYSCEIVLMAIHDSLMRWYEIVRNGGCDEIRREYHKLLYRLDEKHTFRVVGGDEIEATIVGVADRGELNLLHDDGTTQGYLFREIEFVIEGRDR